MPVWRCVRGLDWTVLEARDAGTAQELAFDRFHGRGALERRRREEGRGHWGADGWVEHEVWARRTGARTLLDELVEIRVRRVPRRELAAFEALREAVVVGPEAFRVEPVPVVYEFDQVPLL